MKRWAECASENDRRDALVEATALCGGNVTAIAAVLGVARQQIYGLRQRYGGGADAAEVRGPDTVRIKVDLPRACVEWLEREALRRKQEQGAGRIAKSPIIVDLVERAMREATTEAPAVA